MCDAEVAGNDHVGFPDIKAINILYIEAVQTRFTVTGVVGSYQVT